VKTLLDKTEQKIKLSDVKVEAAKFAAQATLIHAMNESLQATVTKMKDHFNNLMADTSIMNDDSKAWYKMARARIMKEMMASSAIDQVIAAAELRTPAMQQPPSIELPPLAPEQPAPAVIDDPLASSI
jgi:hypothetical protein